MLTEATEKRKQIRNANIRSLLGLILNALAALALYAFAIRFWVGNQAIF